MRAISSHKPRSRMMRWPPVAVSALVSEEILDLDSNIESRQINAAPIRCVPVRTRKRSPASEEYLHTTQIMDRQCALERPVKFNWRQYGSMRHSADKHQQCNNYIEFGGPIRHLVWPLPFWPRYGQRYQRPSGLSQITRICGMVSYVSAIQYPLMTSRMPPWGITGQSCPGVQQCTREIGSRSCAWLIQWSCAYAGVVRRMSARKTRISLSVTRGCLDRCRLL